MQSGFSSSKYVPSLLGRSAREGDIGRPANDVRRVEDPCFADKIIHSSPDASVYSRFTVGGPSSDRMSVKPVKRLDELNELITARHRGRDRGVDGAGP